MADFYFLVIALMALSMLVFTIWNHIVIRRTGRRRSNLNDDKYYELKNKQDYIIAVSAIIISSFGIFGMKTIEDGKNEIRNEYQAEKESLLNLKKASEALTIELNSKKEELAGIQKNVESLLKKNIIQQAIYIVGGIRMKDYPGNSKDGYYLVSYKGLKTISGERIPNFSVPPVIFVSGIGAEPVVSDVTTTGFKITVFSSVYDNTDDVVCHIMIMTAAGATLNGH